jgi:putative methyltransferase (TIGR04325 family)
LNAGDGEYQSWKEAAAASGSYASPVILERVRSAILKLYSGSHVYERDGTAFTKAPADYNLRRILKIVWKPGDTVIDFGGGLGGTYLNNVDVFGKRVNYIVVEQDSFCIEGNKLARKFGVPLKFNSSFVEADVSKHPKVLLFSGVLQYLEHWQSILQHGLSLKPEHIVIDRTPVTQGQAQYFSTDYSDYYRHPITIPLQTINEQYLLSQFKGYTLVTEWESDFDTQEDGNPKGFHLIRSAIHSRHFSANSSTR